MTRRLGRMVWVCAALVAGLGTSAPAWAVIPYEDQITPGELRGIAYAPGDPWLYGYWEYLPTSFVEGDSLPLLVFMPGVGEYDDVSSCPGGTDLCTPADCGGDGLCRNLTWGPQQLIAAGQWDDVLRPFIVVSPQHPVPPFSSGQWDVVMLDAFIQYIVDEYPVDPRRLYLIGMSQGGRGTLQYTRAYPRRFAAVAPSPGGIIDALDASCYFQDTALWVFHGENDAEGILGAGVFNPCSMVSVAYQYENPGLYVGSPQCLSIVGDPRPPGRLTMFDNVDHFAWVPTVDPIAHGFPNIEWAVDQGCGMPATFRQYAPELDSDGVYSWFLSLDRPRVVAPDDVLVDVPEVSLPATITDDDAVAITWTQTGGPPTTLAGADTATLEVSELQPMQEYTFEIYVLDADEQWDRDEVIVTTADVFLPEGSTGGSSSGDGSSTSGGGSSSGELTRGEGSSGSSAAETSAGVSATTGSGGPLDDTAGAADTTGNASSSPGTDSGPVSADSTSGGRETDDAGAVPDDGLGCACHSDAPTPRAAWAWAVVLLALRRRRSRSR